jgi:hypothetical protein
MPGCLYFVGGLCLIKCSGSHSVLVAPACIAGLTIYSRCDARVRDTVAILP